MAPSWRGSWTPSPSASGCGGPRRTSAQGLAPGPGPGGPDPAPEVSSRHAPAGRRGRCHLGHLALAGRCRVMTARLYILVGQGLS
ncbi:unnamed protein product [Gulo gulo]|uniref:Uncharacterized protein n=1 Tax=Gulo gulo TaxID=48420 RepID=A0A9X9M4E9_GULGU|nr:unnamed protein product [Gulo gulo]